MTTDTLKMRIRSQQRWNNKAVKHIEGLIGAFSTDQQQVVNKLLAEFEASPLTEGMVMRAMARRDAERIGEQMQTYKLPSPITAHGAAMAVMVIKGYVSAGEEIVEDLSTQLTAIEALEKGKSK